MAALKRSSSLQTPNTSELEESGRSSPVRSHKLSDAPRTPTPFKRALADVYQRGDPLSNTVSVHLEDDHALSCFMSSPLQPQTPTKLVEDITEIIIPLKLRFGKYLSAEPCEQCKISKCGNI